MPASVRPLLISLCLLATPAAAQPAAPAAVVLRAQHYVAAVNGPGPEAAKRFLAEDGSPALAAQAPPEVIVGFFDNQRRVMGGFDLEGVRSLSATRAEAVLRDRIYGARHGLTLELDGTPAARVTNFDPGPAPVWAGKPPPLPRAELPAAVRATIARGCDAGVFSGAVLVARGDDVLVEAACGLASRRYGAPNRVDTRFNLASINKMFTAVAVMQLVEAGRVSLDDPLSKYADETWLPTEISRQVTVRQLLTHTSGLGSSVIGPAWGRSSPRLYYRLADYKPLVRTETLAFKPGSAFAYSNTGMFMLGVVVEAASGRSYFDYVRDQVFKPAGMTDTESWPMDAPVPNLAMSYGWEPQSPFGWRETTVEQLFRGGPAGGGYATVRDLHRFARALQTGTLVSKASRDVLWTDHPPTNYGAGFTIETGLAGRIVGHDGIFGGVSTQFEIHLDTGYVVAILGNQDYAAPGLREALDEVIARTR